MAQLIDDVHFSTWNSDRLKLFKTFSFKLYKLLILNNMDYFWEYNSVWKVNEIQLDYQSDLHQGSVNTDTALDS